MLCTLTSVTAHPLTFLPISSFMIDYLHTLHYCKNQVVMLMALLQMNSWLAVSYTHARGRGSFGKDLSFLYMPNFPTFT